jgi:hypothetical protein
MVKKGNPSAGNKMRKVIKSASETAVPPEKTNEFLLLLQYPFFTQNRNNKAKYSSLSSRMLKNVLHTQLENKNYAIRKISMDKCARSLLITVKRN